MRKLLCLLLTLLLAPMIASAEAPVLAIDTPAEAIRPGKAFLLSFTAPSDGECDLLLADMAGNTLMQVVDDLPVSAGVNQMWWNGTAAGTSAAEGVYQLVLTMGGESAGCTVVIGPQAPYLTSIVPQMNADNLTMTVEFYASVEGLLTMGTWSGNVWALLENRQVNAGLNSITCQAADISATTTALTLTLTDGTGFSSNEEHIAVNPEDFGIAVPTPTPEITPVPEETVLTPVASPTPGPASDWDAPIVIDLSAAVEIDIPTPTPVPTPTPTPKIIFTPSYGSPYELTDTDAGTYWGTPMDITDEEAIWAMLSAPITVVDDGRKDAYKGQQRVYAEPDDDSRVVAVVTGESQGVRVIEHLDNGWSLIELYSSTFHDNSIQAWNMLVQGYVKTNHLKTKEIDKEYHIVVDKLTQRLYLFNKDGLVSTLLVSTGLSNAKQPYNETRSGEFLYISATGGFKSDNMTCPMAMKFNDGDLLHEVPYIQRSSSSSRIYSTTEPYLGQRASHGCIRVQRKETPEGINMEWIWDNRKDIGRIVVWEDWQGRQIDYPADDTLLYYNPKGGDYYHKAEECASAKANVVFESFTYAELDAGPYAKLDFCPYCAPALRKAEIDKINQEHAFGGDHDPILTEARQKYLDKLVKKSGVESLTEGEKRYYQPQTDE
ncbi:MAG: L,D-transpeptidase family protein [Clostridia bacterium]|nr:L,D-transpeptidase family protein [Clostridia bacterium]